MLSNLTEGVMYMLLVYWTGPLRPILETEASVKWFVRRFEELKTGFSTLRRNPQAAVEAARLAAFKLDTLHDDRLRAIWYVLLALEMATEDEDMRARLKDARDRILDRGLKMVNASYVDEAAEADLVLTRIDDDVIALLRSKRFDAGTVFDLFEAWREAARALGESDRERTRIEADIAENGRGAYARLRADWMQTVKAFRTMLAMCEPTHAALLGEKLDEMERRADARVAARRAAQGAGAAASDAAAGDPPVSDGSEDVFPADGSDGRFAEDDIDAAELAEDLGEAMDDGAGDGLDPAGAPEGDGLPLRPIR